METEPPPKNHLLLQLLIVFLTALLIGFFIGFELGRLIEIIDKLPIPKLPNKELLLIQDNTLKGVSSVITPRPSMGIIIEAKVLDALMDAEPRLIEIFRCESTFDPDACNGENCRGGRGLGQLTEIAIKDCEMGLNKKIFPFDPKSNIECCNYLIRTYGTKPWGTKDTDWGSYDCWKGLIG